MCVEIALFNFFFKSIVIIIMSSSNIMPYCQSKITRDIKNNQEILFWFQLSKSLTACTLFFCSTSHYFRSTIILQYFWKDYYW